MPEQKCLPLLSFLGLILSTSLTGCPVYGERELLPQGECVATTDESGPCSCPAQDIPLLGEPLPGMDTTSVPRRGGTLRLHMDSNLPHLAYHLRADAGINRTMMHDVYQSLIRQDPRTHEYRGELAERWEHSDDMRVWTFHLRHGVLWHDGVPFTAGDVKYTFDAIMNPSNRTEEIRAGWQDVLEPVNAYEAPDDYTFILRLKRPLFTVMQDFHELPILPEHVWSRGDFNSHAAMRAPIGTGPFKFVSWIEDELIVDRNPTYWGRPAYLDRILYKIVTDRETAFSMLKRGDLDFMPRIMAHMRTEGYTPEVQRDFNLTEHLPSQYGYWVYNTQNPIFAAKETRQAMSHLIPVKRIICEIYQCQGATVSGPFIPTSGAYDPDIPYYPYDPEKAIQILEAAGWKDVDGDGIREKEIDGKWVPFRFNFLLTDASRSLEQQVTVVQSSARRAGIDLQITKVDWSIFVERLRKQDFDAASLLWILNYETEPWNLFYSTAPQNYGKWKNEEADVILDKARYEFDPYIRNALYRRFHRILHTEQPYTFVYIPNLPGLITKRFSGLYTSEQWFQEYDIWVNDPSLPEVPEVERHPGHTGAPAYDSTRR